MGQWQHRLIIVVPAARVAAFGAWHAGNIDPTDDCSGWPELNAAGDDSPGSHRWCGAAFTDAEMKLLVGRAAAMSGLTPPKASEWQAWTPAEKRAWMRSLRDQLYAATGVFIAVCDQGGRWDSPDEVLAAIGLARRTTLP